MAVAERVADVHERHGLHLAEEVERQATAAVGFDAQAECTRQPMGELRLEGAPTDLKGKSAGAGAPTGSPRSRLSVSPIAGSSADTPEHGQPGMVSQSHAAVLTSTPEPDSGAGSSQGTQAAWTVPALRAPPVSPLPSSGTRTEDTLRAGTGGSSSGGSGGSGAEAAADTGAPAVRLEFPDVSGTSLALAMSATRGNLLRIERALDELELSATASSRSTVGTASPAALRQFAQRARAVKQLLVDVDTYLHTALSGHTAQEGVTVPTAPAQRQVDAVMSHLARQRLAALDHAVLDPETAPLPRAAAPSASPAAGLQAQRYATEIDRLTAELAQMRAKMLELSTEAAAARKQLRDRVAAMERDAAKRKQEFDFEMELQKRTQAAELAAQRSAFAQRVSALASDLSRTRGLVRQPAPGVWQADLPTLAARLEAATAMAAGMARDPTASADGAPVVAGPPSTEATQLAAAERERREAVARARALEERCGAAHRTIQSLQRELSEAQAASASSAALAEAQRSLTEEVASLKKQLREQKRLHEREIAVLKRGWDEERTYLALRLRSEVDAAKAELSQRVRDSVSRPASATRGGARMRSASPAAADSVRAAGGARDPSQPAERDAAAAPATPQAVARPLSAPRRTSLERVGSAPASGPAAPAAGSAPAPPVRASLAGVARAYPDSSPPDGSDGAAGEAAPAATGPRPAQAIVRRAVSPKAQRRPVAPTSAAPAFASADEGAARTAAAASRDRSPHAALRRPTSASGVRSGATALAAGRDGSDGVQARRPFMVFGSSGSGGGSSGGGVAALRTRTPSEGRRPSTPGSAAGRAEAGPRGADRAGDAPSGDASAGPAATPKVPKLRLDLLAAPAATAAPKE